jgi:lipoprotein-anchoring transpeptidase ErfK/SrfK
MNRLLRLLILTVIISSIYTPYSTTSAAAPTATVKAPTAANEVLCLPGIYLKDPQDCIPAGPSTYLTQMATIGITFPMRPLPSHTPDPALIQYTYRYVKLKENESTPVYVSAEDALHDTAPVSYYEAGKLRFLSYVDEAYLTGGPKPDAFLLRSGGWVAARSVATRWNAIDDFQGLEFNRTPDHAFGWILPLAPAVETKRTPGYQTDDYTGHSVGQYEVVQIYKVEKVNDVEWYLISPDEWISQQAIGSVTPNTTPPEGVTNGRWIEINLFEQTLSVYDHSQLVYATLIATGEKPYYTRPGLFNIYEKLESTPMAGAFEANRSDYYLLQDVPWTMYYDKARALHGAYWRALFGFKQSHGCVNLAPGDAHWLFNWAQEGDWVYVWDPSGQTPTDPAYYGDGGA